MKGQSVSIVFRFCRRGRHAAKTLSQSPIGFVKAGIGGFHTAVKQLAGKACNGVIVKDRVFLAEPFCPMRGWLPWDGAGTPEGRQYQKTDTEAFH